MKLNLYSIRDKLIAYQQPFLQQSEPAAVRAFTMAVNSETPNPVAQAYADMQLWQVGEWDDQTGVITSDLKFVCDGASVKRFSSAPAEAVVSPSAVPAEASASPPADVPVPAEAVASPSEPLTSDQLAYLSSLLKKKEVKGR